MISVHRYAKLHILNMMIYYWYFFIIGLSYMMIGWKNSFKAEMFILSLKISF